MEQSDSKREQGEDEMIKLESRKLVYLQLKQKNQRRSRKWSQYKRSQDKQHKINQYIYNLTNYSCLGCSTNWRRGDKIQSTNQLFSVIEYANKQTLARVFLENACGILNSGGGHCFINGRNDNIVQGFKIDSIAQIKEMLLDQIRKLCRQEFEHNKLLKVEEIKITEDRSILRVTIVPSSRQKEYFVVNNKSPCFYYFTEYRQLKVLKGGAEIQLIYKNFSKTSPKIRQMCSSEQNLCINFGEILSMIQMILNSYKLHKLQLFILLLQNYNPINIEKIQSFKKKIQPYRFDPQSSHIIIFMKNDNSTQMIKEIQKIQDTELTSYKLFDDQHCSYWILSHRQNITQINHKLKKISKNIRNNQLFDYQITKNIFMNDKRIIQSFEIQLELEGQFYEMYPNLKFPVLERGSEGYGYRFYDYESCIFAFVWLSHYNLRSYLVKELVLRTQ